MFRLIVLLMLSGLACGKTKSPFRCADTIGCIDMTTDEPIKIGVLQAMNGKIAPLGMEQLRGLELAMDKIHGKILGHSISLQIVDSGCTAEEGANSVLKVIADPQTVAIFGTTCSEAARTMAHAMSQAGLVMVSGNNSASFLTSVVGKKAPDWNPGFFRTSKNDENAGKAAALFAYEKLNIQKAATIDDGDIYTKGLTCGFIAEFKKLGGQIVLSTSITKGEEQMQPVLTAVTDSRAEFLFFPLFQPEGNQMLVAARKMPGMKQVALMSDGALIENSFIHDVGNAGKGLYFVGPSCPENKETLAFSKAYAAKYKETPSTYYYLYGYDAACLLFSAIEKTAIKEPDGNLHIGRQALRDTLYTTKNFKGVTGILSCNEFGDCAAPSFVILRLDNPAGGVKCLLTNVQAVYTFRH
jgi:branched-chain amino acid transport system substrate-binding protein